MVKEKEERPFCPECGDQLSTEFLKDRETGEIKIVFYCDGGGEDRFAFQISTGLTDEDLEDLRKVGKITRQEMEIKLLERETDTSY